MGLINAIDCNKEDIGLGIVACEQFLNELQTPILIRKGWRMLRTDFEALDASGFVELVQTGDWQPVVGSKNFTADIPDPTTEEYSGGVISVIRNGKPRFQFDYDKGIAFHKALYSKNSFGTYNVGIADSNGSLLLALTADGNYVTGLTAGMVNTRSFMPKSGDTSSNTMFEFQLTNEEQYNRRMALYTTDQSGVDFNEDILPITSVVITGTAEAGDPIRVSVRAWSNEGYGIEGLLSTNLRLINTATNAVVAITTLVPTATPGDYDLTPATATTSGQTYKVLTHDNDTNTNVALIEPNQLYKGVSNVITVAASVVGVFAVMFTNTFA